MNRDHLHDGFAITDDPMGRGVDGPLLGHLVGAAFDGCKPCQNDLLPAVADHGPTTARVVELACIAIDGMCGGLTSDLTDPERTGVLASRAFRILARTGVDGGNEQMFDAAEAMAISDRAAAVDTALELLVGVVGTSAA